MTATRNQHLAVPEVGEIVPVVLDRRVEDFPFPPCVLGSNSLGPTGVGIEHNTADICLVAAGDEVKSRFVAGHQVGVKLGRIAGARVKQVDRRAVAGEPG